MTATAFERTTRPKRSPVRLVLMVASLLLISFARHGIIPATSIRLSNAFGSGVASGYWLDLAFTHAKHHRQVKISCRALRRLTGGLRNLESGVRAGAAQFRHVLLGGHSIIGS